MNAEKWLDVTAQLGEGVVWDDRKNKLYWVDIDGKAIHCTDFFTKEDLIIPTPSRVGMVCLTESGGVLAALEDGIYDVTEQGEFRLFVPNPERGIVGNRFNDGKCDRQGRLWVGTFHMEGKPENGALYRIDPDGTCTKMVDKVTCSNGIAWDKKDAYMYYVDTPSNWVWRFDFNAKSGTISNRTAWISSEQEEGSFDGMTIDANDCLWIGHWNGYRVSCWNSISRKKTGEIMLPIANSPCCTFGGDSLDELFITTAPGGIYRYSTPKIGIAPCRFQR